MLVNSAREDCPLIGGVPACGFSVIAPPLSSSNPSHPHPSLSFLSSSLLNLFALGYHAKSSRWVADKLYCLVSLPWPLICNIAVSLMFPLTGQACRTPASVLSPFCIHVSMYERARHSGRAVVMRARHYPCPIGLVPNPKIVNGQ